MFKIPKLSVGSNTIANTLTGGLVGGVGGASIGGSLGLIQDGKAQEQQAAQQAAQQSANNAQGQQVLNNYMTNPQGGFSLYGSAEEQNNQAAQLSQVGAMTGQNIAGIGQDATQYRDLLQQRLMSADPQSQYMMDQRNRNVANVGRQMAGRGVAGGVAAASVNQAQREADSQINSQMFENQRTNQNDLSKLVQRNQKITGEALASGADRGLANQIDVSAGEGITLICTELKRQGLLPLEVQAADHAHGQKMLVEHPITMLGYHTLAQPIVAKMKVSTQFTQAIAALTVPWAYHIAGLSNLTGFLVNLLGTPICAVVGFFKLFRREAQKCL